MNKLILARELSVAKLKNNLVNLALGLLSVVAIPILVASLARIPSIGLLPVMIAHIIIIFVLLLVTLFRQNISLITKSIFITVALFLVGVMGVWNFGLSGNGVPFLITAIVIASILFSIHIAIAIFLAGLSIIFIHMFMVLSGNLTYAIDVGSYGYLPSTWIFFIISFSFVCVLLLFFLGRFSEFFFDMVENLEQHVADSTIELERIGRAKSEFLANMSHEIRTPINGVLGMLGLLLKSNLDDDQRNKTKLAKSSAESLLTIINDILDYSKIEAGKIDLEISDFDLKDVIEDLSNIAALSAQEKGLELILDTSLIAHSTVLGDAGRVRQILTNLIANAIKFTAIGEVLIQAKTEFNEKNELIFYCSVEDTGLGIPENKIPSLFDIFTQVDASTTRKFGGTGLGLSICKRLCSLMDGEIEVSSEVGKGSKFEFYLKLLPSTQSRFLPQKKLSSVHLLIVDDNDRHRENLHSQLAISGVQISEASSSYEALLLINEQALWPTKNACNIALIDMEMPTTGGIDLIKKIRSNSRLNTVNLVIMSPISYLKDLDSLRQLNVSDVITKPLSISKLITVLDNISTHTDKHLPDKSTSLTDAHQIISSVSNANNNVASPSFHTLNTEEYPGANNPLLRGARLLLVEDNRINQLVAQGILEDCDVVITVATNGLEALTILKSSKDPFELILMDCQMPEMDGYETTRQIRSGKAGANYNSIPIIAMTGNAMTGDREKCLLAGMDDYLAKPLEPQEIFEKLKQWLKLEINISDDSH